MRTYGQHKAIIQDAIKQNVSNRDSMIERNTNVCMQTLAGLFPIGALCRKIEVEAGDNAWLPDNLAGIISVYDSNKVKIHERNAAYVNEDEEVIRYYKENVQATPSNSGLPFVSTGIISAGSNKVYCEDIATLDAASIDTTGMTLRIYNATHKDYYYKIADGSAVGSPLSLTISGAGTTGANGEYSVDDEQLHGWNTYSKGDYFIYAATNGTSWYLTVDEGVGGGLTILYLGTSTIAGTPPTSWSVGIGTGSLPAPTATLRNYSCFEIEGTHPYEEAGSEITILRDQSTRIRFVDADEEEITSGTYTIHYWIYPNPLSLDTDIIPLAYPDVLELMTIRRIPESKDRRPVSKGEIDNALSIAQRREKISAMPAAPRSQQGTPFKFGPMSTSAYGIRGK